MCRGRLCRGLRRQLGPSLVCVTYLMFGMLVYSSAEEGWTLVDAFYFTVVTMSTVGYGDYSPSSPGTKALTILMIFAGIAYVFHEVSDTVGLFTRPLIKHGRRWLERVWPQEVIDLDGSGEEEFYFTIPRGQLLFYTKNLLPDIVLSVMLQCGSAALFRAIEPDWNFGDAFYHCIVTATTVGYGDVPITTQAGKLWACVHILLSVGLIGETIESIELLRVERKGALQRAKQLTRRLDKKMLKELMETAMRLRPNVDRDGEGLSELEFVLAMVIELDMLDWNQVRPFIKQFRTLDVDCSGRLGMHDLQIINSMSSDELAKLRRVNSLSRQAPMVAMKAKATAYFSQRELAGANGNRLSVSGPNVSV